MIGFYLFLTIFLGIACVIRVFLTLGRDQSTAYHYMIAWVCLIFCRLGLAKWHIIAMKDKNVSLRPSFVKMALGFCAVNMGLATNPAAVSPFDESNEILRSIQLQNIPHEQVQHPNKNEQTSTGMHLQQTISILDKISLKAGQQSVEKTKKNQSQTQIHDDVT